MEELTWAVAQHLIMTKAQGKDRRSLVQQEVRASVEEERASRMVGMRQQGAWTRWEHAVDRRVSWAELWKAEPDRIRFLIRAVYDVLQSPSNLFCWGLDEPPACNLCLKRGTLDPQLLFESPGQGALPVAP